jgi:proteasome lid subunit RPN8/RPN11
MSRLALTELLLPADARARIEEAAQRCYPREACGLVLGRRAGERVDVVEVREAQNLEIGRPRDRFVLDPVEHFAAEEDARRRGLEVVGTWHSHPDRPAVPSELDRASAWSGWSTLIVVVERGVVGETRSWRLADGRFAEERVSDRV